MVKRLIMINDDASNDLSFFVIFDEPLILWTSLEKGFIRYTRGIAQYRVEYGRAEGKFSSLSLYFFEDLNGEFAGLKLYDFKDETGVKSMGTGYISQPWVLKLKPTHIHWQLLI